MYFPYLNNKQSENLCIRSLSENNKLQNVIPIIDTNFFDTNTDWTDSDSINSFIDKKFKSLIETLYNNNNKFIIVLNNSILHNQDLMNVLYDKFVSYTNEDINKYCIFGIYDSNVELLDLMFFENKKFSILYSNQIVNQLPREPEYNILLNQNLLLDFMSSQFSHKVVITNSFIKKSVNREYLEDDVFSNFIFSYLNSGFVGFGDYTILPSNLSTAEGGNMNNITVASHLTYKENDNLCVRHYICTPEEEPDNRERVKNVLTQIRENQHLFFATHGLNTLVSLDGTSLGKLKQLSMEHHIEKTNYLLSI